MVNTNGVWDTQEKQRQICVYTTGFPLADTKQRKFSLTCWSKVRWGHVDRANKFIIASRQQHPYPISALKFMSPTLKTVYVKTRAAQFGIILCTLMLINNYERQTFFVCIAAWQNSVSFFITFFHSNKWLR